MKLVHIAAAALATLISTQSNAFAETNTFTDRSAFEQATEGLAAQDENFDNFANGQHITSLFGGLAQFADPTPTIFFGGWNAYGTAGQFSGGSLIAETRCQGHPLTIHFPQPVLGVGANAFDDYDGTNVITLVVTTTTGEQFTVSENFPYMGDTGFLGATASQGITRVEYMDNGNSCIEIDLLRVVPMPPDSACECGDSATNQTTVIDFDGVQTLADYQNLGVTFSNASIWYGGAAPSVLVDVNGGAYSAPNALCMGSCGGQPGDILFDSDVNYVSIWALSGPGSDLINAGTEMEAFDANGQSLGTRLARSDVQYDQLAISAPGIRRVRLYSPYVNHEAWDHLEFRRTQADPVCNAALVQAQDDLATAQASLAQANALLATTSAELASANASINEGRLALQEIVRLANMPPGQRQSSLTWSGALSVEINAAIGALVAKPGNKAGK